MNDAPQISQVGEFRGREFGARRVPFTICGLYLLVAAVLAGCLTILSAAPAEAQQQQLRFAEKRSIVFASVARDRWRSQLLAEVNRLIGEKTRRFDEQLKLLEEERQRLADLVRRLEGVTAFKIGVAAPMSGSDRAFGEHIALGVQEAIADLNVATDILGRRMEVVVMDDKGDAAEGVAVAERMAEQGVRIVIGHMNSGVAFAASKIYNEKGILMITPSATNVQITDQQLWNVFRTCGRDDQQGEVAGIYIAEKLVGKKIAVLHDNTLYGKGLAEVTLATMRKLGVAEVLYRNVDLKSPDFFQIVNDLKRVRPDVVFWGGPYEGGKLLRQMHEAGVKATMMSGDGIFADEFAEFGGTYAEGTLMTYHPDWQKSPEAKVLTERLLRNNSKSGPFTYYSYAAVEIVVAAANEARTLNTRRIAEVMRSKRDGWPTIIGPIGFDEKGDITRQDYVMWTWQKGADSKIKPVQN